MAPQFNLIRPQTIREGYYPVGSHAMTIFVSSRVGGSYGYLRVHGNRYYVGSWYETRKVQPVVRYEAN